MSDNERAAVLAHAAIDGPVDNGARTRFEGQVSRDRPAHLQPASLTDHRVACDRALHVEIVLDHQRSGDGSAQRLHPKGTYVTTE